VQALGQMIFNHLNRMFIEFVKVEDMSIETLKAGVARQNAALAQLLRVEGKRPS
jgi:hypothetical protein